MNKLTLTANQNYWLLVTGEMAVVSCAAVSSHSLLLNLSENSVYKIPCMCCECMRYEVWSNIVEVCDKNKIKTLIVDHDRGKERPKDLRVVGMRDKNLPSQFRLLPFWEYLKGGIINFPDKKAMLQWCICHPDILFKQEMVPQYGGYAPLAFVRAVDNQGLLPWLEEVKAVDQNFDPMRFLDYLNMRTPVGEPVRDVDIPKIVKDLF